MSAGIDRRWGIIILFALMIVSQILFPGQYSAVIAPVMVGLAAVWMFRGELVSFDFNVVKDRAFWREVYNAVVVALILQAIGILLVQYGFGIKQPEIGVALTAAVPLVVVLFLSPMEELVFRRNALSLLERRIGFWPAAAVSSVLFAAAHYNYSAFLGNVAVGMVWCRAYKKTGNLLVVIVAHMIFNFLVAVAQSFRQP